MEKHTDRLFGRLPNGNGRAANFNRKFWLQIFSYKFGHRISPPIHREKELGYWPSCIVFNSDSIGSPVVGYRSERHAQVNKNFDTVLQEKIQKLSTANMHFEIRKKR